LLLFFFCCLAAATPANAQETRTSDPVNDDTPIVSLLGEDEATLTELLNSHGTILLDVCGNDMEIAYAQWMDLLGAMEDYSKEINYDIRGVKAYLHVFWNADGSLRYISFFPKANSRNVPIAELRAFFKGFVKNYKMDIDAESGFNHYASGSFPVFDRPALSAKKD
jgi:hypothetical protein